MEVYLVASDTDYEGYDPIAIFTSLEAAKAERHKRNEAETSPVTRWVVLRFALDEAPAAGSEFTWNREVA